MGLANVWKNNRFIIVMGPAFVLIHLVWYKIQSSPVFQPKALDFGEEPALVTYALQQKEENKGK